jgi:outer membrane lipoprotein-sorting protein
MSSEVRGGSLDIAAMGSEKVGKGDGMNQSFIRHAIGVMGMLVLMGNMSAQTQTPVAGMTAQEILSRMAQSLGGVEKLSQVQNIQTRGTVEVSGLTGTVEDWQTAGGQHKQVVDLGAVFKQTTIFDGKRGWVIDRNSQISELVNVTLEKEILSNYLGTFSHLIPGRLLGSVTMSGEDPSGKYYLLQIKPQGGRDATYYVDKASFLPARMAIVIKGSTSTTDFEDWREVSGIKVPFIYRQTESDPSNNSVLKQESVVVNAVIDRTIFARPEPAVSDFRFTNGRKFSSMPLDVVGNAIFVQAQINNSAPQWFILDTGANATLIDARRVRALGLKSAGKVGASVTGGSTEVTFTKGVTFTVPGAKLMNQTVASIPFTKEFTQIKRNFGGILGYDFISRFVMEIDYLNKRLTLYDAKSYSYKGPGKRVPIVLEGTPKVSAEVKVTGQEPVEGLFELDTGYDGAATLYRPFVNAHKFLEPQVHDGETTRHGVGQETTSVTSRIESINFGGFSFRDVVTHFPLGEEGSGGDKDTAGLIGNDILRRFKLILDYSRQEMILEPNARLADPFGANVSGLELEDRAKPRRIVRVTDVSEESAAAEAGIKPGDEIIAIDNQLATSLTLEQIEKLLQQQEQKFVLTLKRASRVFKATLTTKKRI